MGELDGKAFLVVGATGALGSRVAAGLAARGAALTVSGRDQARLDEADLGSPDVHRVTGDLRQPDTGRRLVEAAREHHGRLDGVLILAGVAAFGPLTEIDDDTVDDLILIDFLGPLRLARSALGVLEPDGVLLNVSAVLAEAPMAGMATYSAVKAAAAALFTALRKEARRSKIRVVDVRPPHTETGLIDRAIAGTPPKLPNGLAPDAVAERIVAAVLGDDTEVGSGDFSS